PGRRWVRGPPGPGRPGAAPTGCVLPGRSPGCWSCSSLLPLGVERAVGQRAGGGGEGGPVGRLAVRVGAPGAGEGEVLPPGTAVAGPPLDLDVAGLLEAAQERVERPALDLAEADLGQ